MVLLLAFCLAVPILPCSLCRSDQVVILVDQIKGVEFKDCPCCGARGRMTLANGLRSKLAGDDPKRWR
jgi:hypothetical protein